MEPTIKLPFYRTRKFWGFTMLAIFIAWSFIVFILTPFNGLELLLTLIGATTYELIGFSFASKLGSYLVVFVYIIIQFFLLMETFKKPNVKTIIPVIAIILFLVGIGSWILFLGSY